MIVEISMGTTLIIVAAIFIVIGIILLFFNLPGLWVIWITILVTSVINDFEQFPVWLIILYFFIVLTLQLTDVLFATAGSKKFGASKWGMTGALVGGLLGFLILNVIGLLIGPFIGAVVFEYVFAKKDINQSIKAGIGTFFGIVMGIALKVGTAITMSGIWLWLLLR